MRVLGQLQLLRVRAISVDNVSASHAAQSVVYVCCKVAGMYPGIQRIRQIAFQTEEESIMQYVVPITQPNWLDSRAETPVDQVICALNEKPERTPACLAFLPSFLALFPPPPPSLPSPTCRIVSFDYLTPNSSPILLAPILTSLCNSYPLFSP